MTGLVFAQEALTWPQAAVWVAAIVIAGAIILALLRMFR